MMMDWVDHCRSEWAWLDVDEIVNGDPEKAWSFLRDMIDITPEASLGAVGAGPLESFVHQNGKVFIERIEDAAATDPKFRKCLDTIYCHEPKDLAQRVKDALAAPPVKQRPRTGSISKARARIVTAWLHHSDTYWATDYLNDLIDSDPYTALRLIVSFANILAQAGDTDSLDDLSLHAFDPLINRHGPAVYDDVIEMMQRYSTIRTWVLSRQNGIGSSPAWEELLRRLP
jgi:hypothetical protein